MSKTIIRIRVVYEPWTARLARSQKHQEKQTVYKVNSKFALHDAIIAGDAAAVRRAIADGADVNATVGAGHHSMLTIAARGCLGDMPDVVRALLDAGAEVNPASGARPLYWAIVCGRTETVRLLLDAGATVTDDDLRNASDMVTSSRAACAQWDGATQDDMRAAEACHKMSANIAKQLAA